MIKAILFDMDGVLIDAREWHYEALNEALALFGMTISRTEHLAVYDGLPTRKKLEILTNVAGLSPLLHDFINEFKQKLTLQLVATRCVPVFQHQYALSRLKRKGLELVVCSNSVRNTVKSMMERADLLQYLNFFLSNQDVSKPKPDPEIYLKAIDELGLTPKEVLILEDNEHGIMAARASQAHVLVVASPADVDYDRIVKEIDKIEAEK